MTNMSPGDRIILTANSAAPITRDHLRRMINACGTDTLAGTRDRALLAYAWQTRSRRAALVAARIDTIPLDQLDNITPTLSPRELLTDWLLALAIELRHPAVDGPLFRPVNRHDHLGPHPQLSPEGVNSIVHRAVARARIPHPKRYSSLSLYHGGRLGL